MIQWYPGHMAKAIREIKQKATIADLFIIVLDARAPISTYNNDFDEIAPHKPRLIVVTKIDLADSTKLDKIKEHFANSNRKIVIGNLKKQAFIKKIMSNAKILLEPKRQKDMLKGLRKPRLRAIIVGVPNSGKSTLINALAKKSSARVGNKPGVTRGQQWINTDTMELLDTPGILWPKFEDESVGVKLAIIGSIRIEIIPQQDLFYDGYKLLSQYYPQKIKELKLKPCSEEQEIYSQLITMCENRNLISLQGKVDLKKGYTFFFNYLKNLKGVTYD